MIRLIGKSVALALALCVALCMGAVGEQEARFPEMGIVLRFPEAFEDLSGDENNGTETAEGSGVYRVAYTCEGVELPTLLAVRDGASPDLDPTQLTALERRGDMMYYLYDARDDAEVSRRFIEDVVANIEYLEPIDGYAVRVVDQDGSPVEGVVVQFCDDTACMFGATDADGLARFDAAPGSYRTHVLVPPEGYAADEAETPALGTVAQLIVTKG